jgi:hypothetical protein
MQGHLLLDNRKYFDSDIVGSKIFWKFENIDY